MGRLLVSVGAVVVEVISHSLLTSAEAPLLTIAGGSLATVAGLVPEICRFVDRLLAGLDAG